MSLKGIKNLKYILLSLVVLDKETTNFTLFIEQFMNNMRLFGLARLEELEPKDYYLTRKKGANRPGSTLIKWLVQSIHIKALVVDKWITCSKGFGS